MIVCVIDNLAHYKLAGKELKLKFTNKEHIRSSVFVNGVRTPEALKEIAKYLKDFIN